MFFSPIPHYHMSLKKIYVNGFPSLYGGAGTELHHQIIVWKHMGIDVHLIPTNNGFENEALYLEMPAAKPHQVSRHDMLLPKRNRPAVL